MNFFSVTLAAMTVLGAPAQAQATLEGTIRDAHNHAAVGANVSLQAKGEEHTRNSQTDAQGRYRFAGLSAGSYTLHAQTSAATAALGPFTLGSTEVKKLDLTLQAAPEFFDEPQFIVAGVTDGASHGGHGSDTMVRSTAALARDAASLANTDESMGPLETVRRLQQAAEADPSESNLFAWGAELLKHGADQPAETVFIKGHRLFPRSARTLLGLAVSLYDRGSFDPAAQRFFEACDLNRSDPTPYLFLAKVESAAIKQAEGFLERMARFAALQPENAWANYYYAVSLWSRRQSPDDQHTLARVRSLLEKAIALDPGLGAAYLQMGIVHAEQNDFPGAIAAYQRAIEATPGMEEPHYRLAQAYRRTGEKLKAQKELELYDQLSKDSAQRAERERGAMQRFVVQLQERAPAR